MVLEDVKVLQRVDEVKNVLQDICAAEPVAGERQSSRCHLPGKHDMTSHLLRNPWRQRNRSCFATKISSNRGLFRYSLFKHGTPARTLKCRCVFHSVSSEHNSSLALRRTTRATKASHSILHLRHAAATQRTLRGRIASIGPIQHTTAGPLEPIRWPWTGSCSSDESAATPMYFVQAQTAR
jgi:hypothetical protein